MGFSQNSFFFAVLFKSILRSRFICIFFVSAKKNNTFLSKTTLYILMEDDKISLAKVQHIKVLTIFNKKKSEVRTPIASTSLLRLWLTTCHRKIYQHWKRSFLFVAQEMNICVFFLLIFFVIYFFVFSFFMDVIHSLRV